MSSEPRTALPAALPEQLGRSAFIAVVSLFALTGAWALQWAGYAPCELCLKERIPHYGGIPLAIVVAFLAARGPASLLPAGFAALALVYGGGTAMSGYHTGVEWQFWPGPSSCTGAYAAAKSTSDFLHQLQTVNVVRCDAPSIRILGLSLAAWNLLICLGLAVVALRSLAGLRAGRR